MAAVTNDHQMTKAPMPDEENEPDELPVPSKGSGGKSGGGGSTGGSGGFFHIYKSGQGYWTRMGTVAGAALIILFTASFLYTYLPLWFDALKDHRNAMLGILLGVIGGLSLAAFWFMNKPANADFLIATDSEMKKVNWTSRKELIGSTKVVIVFVVLITSLLFVIDILFGYVFYFLKVLKQPPLF